jgi:Lon protease-like protein
MDGESIYIPTTLPLFPLPEVVLFPRAVLPLHIFEPRYRDMTADALAGARTIGVALLKPGFEPHYHTRRAPIHTVIGVGQIIASEQLADGNFNILLRGVARARILEELPQKPYRVARIRPLTCAAGSATEDQARLRDDLRKTVQTEPVGGSEIQEYWLKLLDTALELGEVTDLIASGLPVDAELRQCLLAELDATARTTLLTEQLRTLAAVLRNRRTQSPAAEWKMN